MARLVVTGNYLKVRIPPGHSRNEWVQVRVIGARRRDPLDGRAALVSPETPPLPAAAPATVPAFHNQLAAGGADITSAAFSHRDDDAPFRERPCETVDRPRPRAGSKGIPGAAFSGITLTLDLTLASMSPAAAHRPTSR